LSPIFVFYSFSSPVDFRLTARFERPEFTKSERADDSAGYAEFTTAWRDQNAVLTTSSGPDLYLATLPAGRTASIDGTGMVKEVDSTSEVVLCIDATESNVPGGVGAGKTYVDGWRGILGGYTDTEYSRALDHVSLASDNPKFDKLFADSIDAIESHQFASGNLLADLFFYRDSWIRDGSYTIIGLSLAGNYKAAERFFAFWDANRNSYVGGEREAQQPAIGVTAMWLYSRLAPDGTAFLKTHWSYVLDY
jgi:GH15 family glucan-1,4-alpha-glucosidase